MPEFRRLSIEDIPSVSKLEKETFGSEAWSEKDYIEVLGLSYAYYLVVYEGEKLIGSCGLRNMCGDGEITNVMIVPNERKKGIGEKMLLELMSRTKEIGVREFTLEVRSQNMPAIGLYKKLGFVEEGMRPKFYTDPSDDAVIMWKRQ
ncbi:ribosomal-protein-alanine N-acetyltransferase [Lachnospiraceae bacterium]|nr:ribosomal-protein-alanine N-acetyltransferase [Lachnospiraceae bacterium]